MRQIPMRRSLFLSAAVLLGTLPALAETPLAPHRAVYDLKLRTAKNLNAVERVQGRIVYEFQGNACEGYALNFRQVTEVTNGEGESNLSDLRSATFEEGDGKNFRFTAQTFTNRQLEKDVDGRATEEPDGAVAVEVKKPAAFSAKFPGPVVFPTEHLRRTIEAGEKGDATLAATVYDGSETGEKAYPTLSVIGKAIPAGQVDGLEDPARAGPLATQRRWPVSVSYFDPAKVGETTPIYTLGFELYENGVSRALRIDYGDFVLDGTLTELRFLPAKACGDTPPAAPPAQ